LNDKKTKNQMGGWLPIFFIKKSNGWPATHREPCRGLAPPLGRIQVGKKKKKKKNQMGG
jgi:hypothetical protein